MRIRTSKIPTDRDTFVYDIIKRRGAKQIGAGKYGSVFAIPDDPAVIKVCRDDAYKSFLTEVLKHQDNPWFPQVESATEYFPADEPPYLVVIMERLRKGTTREIDGALCLFDNERFEDITAMVEILGIEPNDKTKHLGDVRRVLTRLYKNYGPDFHKGNIMFRENQAVITDPVVSGETNTIPPTVPLVKETQPGTIAYFAC